MVNDLLLASSSSIRKQLFEKANVSVKCVKPNVDEESVKACLILRVPYKRAYLINERTL